MNALRSHLTRLLILAVVVSSGLLALSGVRPAGAEDGPARITVKVTDAGFDPKSIEVNQGQVVELTFVWSQPAHPEDEHIMVGYNGIKFESEKIDRDHKETTVKFIATQAGTFNYKCDVECDLHDDLQKGEIKVKGAGGAAAASSGLQQPKLLIDPVTGVVVNGNSVSIAATLQDKDGAPISKSEVRFYVERQFLGRTSEMEIGVGKTGANGVAYAIYHPTTPDAGKVIAKFAGGGLYDAAEQTINLAGSPQFQPLAAATPDDDLHGIKTFAPYALVVVIGGVWASFAFMLFEAWSVSRVTRGGESPKSSH